MKCSRCGRKISKDDSFDYEYQTLCQECFYNDEKITAVRDEAIEQTLRKLLPLGDTISLVVTGHLIIEYWLDWLIKLKIQHPKRLFDSARLTFSQKVCLAESLGLLRDEYVKAIRILNNIRNHFSHDLEYQISPGDLNTLQTLAPSLSNEEQSAMNMLGSPKKELISFCISFAGYANGCAFGYVAGLRGSKKRRRQTDT